MFTPFDSSMLRTNFLPFEWTKTTPCWCGAVIEGALPSGKEVINLMGNLKVGYVFVHRETSISSTSQKISDSVGSSEGDVSCSGESILCFFFFGGFRVALVVVGTQFQQSFAPFGFILD
jgi:hypothetical protein